MNPIEFALYISAAFAVIVFYKITTTRMALAARQSMVPVVNSIIHDNNVPEQIKEFAIGAFHTSARPDFLRRFIWSIITKQIKADREKSRILSEHSKLVDKVIREHLFRINALAAPHWYFILFLTMMIAVACVAFFTLGRSMGKRVTKMINRLSNPEWFIVHCSEKDCS